MSSLYANYLKERTDDQILETTKGFATYRYINDKSVYIIDIYTIPEARKSGYATELTNKIVEIAKSEGCAELLGTVVPGMKGSTEGLKAFLAYGMQLSGIEKDMIILRKEI